MECHLCLWAQSPSVSLWRLISIPWLCPSRIGCARLLFSTTPLSQLQITTTLHHIMPFINTNLIYFLLFLFLFFPIFSVSLCLLHFFSTYSSVSYTFSLFLNSSFSKNVLFFWIGTSLLFQILTPVFQVLKSWCAKKPQLEPRFCYWFFNVQYWTGPLTRAEFFP